MPAPHTRFGRKDAEAAPPPGGLVAAAESAMDRKSTTIMNRTSTGSSDMSTELVDVPVKRVCGLPRPARTPEPLAPRRATGLAF